MVNTLVRMIIRVHDPAWCAIYFPYSNPAVGVG